MPVAYAPSAFAYESLANASKSEILEAWKEVQTVATYGGVALLYYSGHGARSNGDDLIVPVDATFPESTQNCISVSELMREISAFGASLKAQVVNSSWNLPHRADWRLIRDMESLRHHLLQHL